MYSHYKKVLGSCGLKDSNGENVQYRRIQNTVDIHAFGSTYAIINSQFELTRPEQNRQTSTVTVYIATCNDTEEVLVHIHQLTGCVTPLLLLVQTTQSPRTDCTIPEGIRHAYTTVETLVDDINDLLERYAMDVTFRMATVLQNIRGVLSADLSKGDAMPVVLECLGLSLNETGGKCFKSMTICFCNAVSKSVQMKQQRVVHATKVRQNNLILYRLI